MARLSANLSILLVLCLAFQAALGNTIATSCHNLNLNVNVTVAQLTSAPKSAGGCAVANITLVSLFPNDTVILPQLYQSSTANQSLVTLTADAVTSKLKLDGSVCITLPPLPGINGAPHLCNFQQDNVTVIAELVTQSATGGNYVNGTDSFSGLDIPIAGLPVNPISIVETCAAGSTNNIKNLNSTLTLVLNSDQKPYSSLTVTHVVIKTRHIPEYKVIDITNLSVVPFAKPLPASAAVAAPAASGNASNGSATPATPVAPAPTCYGIPLTYANLTQKPDVTCFLVGCDVLLIANDGNNVAILTTYGLQTPFALTSVAIGLIVGLVVGILILCSCICGIVYLCKKKQDPEAQRLVETR